MIPTRADLIATARRRGYRYPEDWAAAQLAARNAEGPQKPPPATDYTALSNKYLSYLERVDRDTRATAELLRRRSPKTEPEIPADVWEAAKEAANAFTVPESMRPRLAGVAVRAILAERERCAALIESFGDHGDAAKAAAIRAGET